MGGGLRCKNCPPQVGLLVPLLGLFFCIEWHFVTMFREKRKKGVTYPLPILFYKCNWITRFLMMMMMMMMMVMMMMNSSCAMVDRRKALSLISSQVHCQRFSWSSTIREQDINLRRTWVQTLLNEVVKWWYLLHHGVTRQKCIKY